MDITKVSVCDIEPYISNMKGIPSGSASNSDQWFVDFKTKFKFGQDNISSAFMKIFPTASSVEKYFSKYIYHPDKDYTLTSLEALSYEAKIYNETNNLLLNHVSPCFLAAYGLGSDCSYDSLVSIVQKTLKLTKDQAEKRFNRNIAYCLTDLGRRPAIQEPINNREKNFNTSDIELLKYKIILNENLKNDKSFDKFLQDKSLKSQDFWSVLFQLAVAIYSLGLAGINHNDLHIGNIFIHKLKKPELFIYSVNDKRYIIETDVVPKIFDYDRAYSVRLGNNEINIGNNCSEASQCNDLIPNKDFIKVCCYIYKYFSKFRNDLENVIASSTETKKILKNLYMGTGDCFLRQSYFFFFRAFPKADYVKFNSITEIIENIYKKHINVKINISQKISLDNIYVCNKNFFSNYTVLPDKVKANRELELTNYLNSKPKTAVKSRVKSVFRPKSKPRSPVVKAVKPCRTDQERNPATGRCRLIRAKKSVSRPKSKPRKRSPVAKAKSKLKIKATQVIKPCGTGKERNPATGRCRKIKV